MSELPSAYPRPASQPERVALRGCFNCLYRAQDATGEQFCARSCPSQHVPSVGWCGAWVASWNPRINWNTAFAGIELINAGLKPDDRLDKPESIPF